jgi:hypothetical protein
MLFLCIEKLETYESYMNKNYGLKIAVTLLAMMALLICNELLYKQWKSHLSNKNSVQIQKIATTIEPKFTRDQKDFIRVAIDIKDTATEKVISAEFYNYIIPLYPADPSNRRAEIYFKMIAGKYQLIWKVKKENSSISTLQKTIELNKNNNWVSISIEGSEITVS